ncbi:Glutamate synthase (NADPH) small chain [uncultured Defluviicoccus sp.]|uniref:Glutamate synthase (NADPH) small chain n=1 Tax=metagenome TaxID=256318 RepID=A0A380TJR7_9ZZZZ|nr:Glutamate synthase (NADPH) small chain [uncultured Defluviicoccus sp.]
MGKPTGFLEITRRDRAYEPISQRVHHWHEFVVPQQEAEISRQGARCMDCGIPYCHQGCPINNIIPDWNDLVFKGQWREALDVLHSTNNFPEFTGRVCPAPCEAACTLNLFDQPVTIKSIECAIIDKGWAEGWVLPQIPARRTGRRVAVVGSGPSGLACAQQLARAGHAVVVYEKRDRIGGLLRYGIPDFKMEKKWIDRRMAQMQAEGVEFRPNSHVGAAIPVARLMEEYDILVLSGGSERPRGLPVPGGDLAGVHYAMDFLTQQNARIGGRPVPEEGTILATGKDVIVIGGGDTGSDCVGTSIRQGAKSVTQLEILPRPPEREDKGLTWPNWPLKLRTSTSQEEGCARDWAVSTKRFLGNGKLEGLELVRVEWVKDANGGWQLKEINESAFTIPADLALLAMGFVGPEADTLIGDLGVARDSRGNIAADPDVDPDGYRTSVDRVFACGDMRRGQSLVVWAIREGRQCARAVDQALMGYSDLPR